jgi:hypothetical protein
MCGLVGARAEFAGTTRVAVSLHLSTVVDDHKHGRAAVLHGESSNG